MVTLLRRLFIRDYQNVASETVRVKHGILAAWLGLLINAILVGLKLTFAFLLASQNAWIFPMALLADAIDNAGDMASNIVTLIGFAVAGKPADKEHPFGHERMEYIVGMVVSILVMFAGIELIKNSISSLINGDLVTYSWTVVIVLAVSIALKALQGFWNLSLAKTISSPSLKATAIDSFTDTLATLSVMVSAILGIAFGWNFLDGYFGIAVAGFVIFSAFRMLKETVNPLIGDANSAKDIEAIEKFVLQEKKILGVHDVLIHRYGPTKTFLSLHAEVSAENDLVSIHDLISDLEEKLNALYGAETIIHIDPVTPLSEEKKAIKDRIIGLVQAHCQGATVHDFRILSHQGKEIFEFDVVVPFGEDEDEKALLRDLKQGFPDNEFKIKFDRPYAN